MFGSGKKKGVGLAAVAVAAGLVATPVEAQGTGWCGLSIKQVNKSTYTINNRCTPDKPADKATQIIVWGEDWPDLDDYLTNTTTVGAATSFVVSAVVLNEDGASRDEVYTETRFQRPNNTYYTIKSNVVKRQFLPVF
ncbi:hypothetical protein [Actinocorallia sp. A-T 12471]|uniref:hypothetical protein n=1 Tax=Actinocorallia sp. A-T 12471 TaxID=3089813 RepID=UPI0029D0DC90|nr:hypothetical protein [Actinocorallia sp. A-T 12471]MDX6742008.1 hypothetical protein [Actinocorallia sp. A-T 12471]